MLRKYLGLFLVEESLLEVVNMLIIKSIDFFINGKCLLLEFIFVEIVGGNII